MRVEKESVYVLHARPYRNTSLIVDFLSAQHGRVSAVARSARGVKSRYRGLLQPFSRLCIGWTGRHELKSLGSLELDGLPFSLQGVALFSGLYLNELLVRLLPKEEENQALFLVYEKALQHLASGQFAPALRRFEKQLLQTLGYGLSFSQDAMGDPIQPEGFYYLVLEQGFLPTTEQAGQDYRLLGRHLLAIAADDYQDLAVQQVAKTIMRRLINAQLTQPLKSREYLQKMLA